MPDFMPEAGLDPHGQPLVCSSCGRRSSAPDAFRWVWRREEYGFLSCRRVCTPSCDYASLLDEVRSTRALCQRLYGTIRTLRPAESRERQALGRALHYSNQIRTRIGRVEEGVGDLHQDIYLAEVARGRAPPPAPPGEPPPGVAPRPPEERAPVIGHLVAASRAPSGAVTGLVVRPAAPAQVAGGSRLAALGRPWPLARDGVWV